MNESAASTPRTLDWHKDFNEGEPEVWIASSPYTDCGTPAMWRIREVPYTDLGVDRPDSCWKEDHDPELPAEKFDAQWDTLARAKGIVEGLHFKMLDCLKHEELKGCTASKSDVAEQVRLETPPLGEQVDHFVRLSVDLYNLCTDMIQELKEAHGGGFCDELGPSIDEWYTRYLKAGNVKEDPQLKERIFEMRRALTALYLEVDESIAKDINQIFLDVVRFLPGGESS